MNSVGGFREGEINGKPFHIYTLLSSQTNNLPSSSSSGEAAIVSGVDDLSTSIQPLFICQSFQTSNQWTFRRYNDPNLQDFLLVDVHPHFFNKTRSDEQFEYSIGSEIHDHPCKLPLVPLFWCNNKETEFSGFRCRVCRTSMFGTDYYLCVICEGIFHKECIECPLEIKKHPSFPFLSSLKLYYRPPDILRSMISCFCCHELIYNMVYYCPTYKIILHPLCAMKPISIVIDHPKRHPHPLIFFPKQISLPCDVCGLIKEFIPTYVCAQCVFVVHQDCIYHPYVIKISRHNHRIYFTYSLPSGILSCGVCRRKVNNDYGAYSCDKCGDYFVHTRCALQEDLWDGKELEGVPEEPEEVVEPPFKMISDGIILYFLHDHHLKLEISRVYDEGRVCQACVLPIYEGNYYACMDQCNFVLHESCANAPRKIQHALNALSLELKIPSNEYNGGQGCFFCVACWRESCGFVYDDSTDHSECFILDLRCALVSEPFEYEGHEHPLFLALTPEEEKSAICQICQEEGEEPKDRKKLTCIQCGYIICFRCATLPYKARYKHDKHFLTFQKREEASDHSGWCEVCEGEIVYSRKGGFYSCDDYCSTTLHVDCLLGKDTYMKPGQTIYGSQKVSIFRNNTMSRPLCYVCKQRCPHKVVFNTRNGVCCCLYCKKRSR